jgi:hypothetical protein
MDKSLCQVESCKNYKKYNRYCIHKVESIKPASSIKKVSDKTADILKKKYNPLSKAFIKTHPKCQAKLVNCEGVSTCIHHISGRLGDKLIDPSNFLAVCFSCHRLITDDSKMAIEKGFSKSRLNKDTQ